MENIQALWIGKPEEEGKMTEQDIIVGLNSIAAKYGYGKNGNEAFSNDEWNTIALSLVEHAIAGQVTGHDGVSAEYIAQKAKEYILQN